MNKRISVLSDIKKGIYVVYKHRMSRKQEKLETKCITAKFTPTFTMHKYISM